MKTKVHHSDSFVRTVQKSREWVRDVMRELGSTDEGQAQRVFRSVLHVLRDRLAFPEAIQLGSQLPMLVRGFYFENWRPRTDQLKERRNEVLLPRIRKGLLPSDRVSGQAAARAVFKVLDRHVSAGEIEDVKMMLPRGLRRLWPGAANPTPVAKSPGRRPSAPPAVRPRGPSCRRALRIRGPIA